MSSGDRIRGQETNLYVVSNGITQSFTSIKSFDIEAMLHTLEEKYVGQTTNSYDDIFDGFSGKIEINVDGPAVYTFMNQLILRAQRRVPLFRVNAATTINFPIAGRVRYYFSDLYFDGLPVNTPSRTDYLVSTLTWKCQNSPQLSAST